jgi:hypothetical protein
LKISLKNQIGLPIQASITLTKKDVLELENEKLRDDWGRKVLHPKSKKPCLLYAALVYWSSSSFYRMRL